MNLNDFMHENYPNLQLRPPLFYNWGIGIRFELGLEKEWFFDSSNNLYVLGCYNRAITLFESLHSPTDDIFVVMDMNNFDVRKKLKRQLQNFSPYIKKSLFYSLKHQELPFIFPEDDEDGTRKTNRFTLTCKTMDLNHVALLKAVCNQDLGFNPSISHNVYVINIQKKTIFHTYDDRGCDVLATSPAAIKEIYTKYSDWILDYDRVEIDKLFE
ncbi:DUF3885 domain-containing protein [Desemzia sp. FAM 23991]|uniref:DUF3885 domain-containing protein n=1 Tax=unclassified Desemzia TaxID=2685243 RepID=UPI0038859E3B